MSPQPFPWREVMALGLGVLRLPPAAFWAMTPREFQAALEGLQGTPFTPRPPSRSALERLMRAYPDAATPPRQGDRAAGREQSSGQKSSEQR